MQLVPDTPSDKRGRRGWCFDSTCTFENEVRCKRMDCNDVHGNLAYSDAEIGNLAKGSPWKRAVTCEAFVSHAC